jgi:hypothetical protein
MFGLSTFGIAMALLRLFSVPAVDRILLAAARLALGDTGKLGLRRPKTGPMELKNLTGRTPVLDVGTLGHIKTGKIKVSGSRAFTFTKGEISHARPVKPWEFGPRAGRPAVGQWADYGSARLIYLWLVSLPLRSERASEKRAGSVCLTFRPANLPAHTAEPELQGC